MFRKFLMDWKDRRAESEMAKHPVLRAVIDNTHARLAESPQAIGWPALPEEREALLRQCTEEIRDALAQPIPVQAIRLKAFAHMQAAARCDLLVMQPETLPFKRFLSGELGSRIHELEEKSHGLADLFGSSNAPPENLAEKRAFLLARHWRLHLQLTNFDIARTVLGDWHRDPTRDWFRPAYVSACIFREDVYRGELGVAGLIEPAKAMYCSAWVEFAEAGEQHLRAVWEDGWQELFGEPSPFAGWDGSA